MYVFFVNGTALHFTLDELFKVFLRLPSLLTALGFITSLAVFSAYSDLNQLLWYERVLFWIIGVPVFAYCYLSSLLFFDMLCRRIKCKGIPEPLVMFCAAIFATSVMAPCASAIASLNYLGLSGIALYVVYNFFLWEIGVLLYVSFVFPKELAHVRQLGDEKAEPATLSTSLVIGTKSWPMAEIICISAQDHYLTVFTHTESEMVLGRLSDLADVPQGQIVHRSHWVKLTAIRKVRRSDGKLLLVLENGLLIPVARGRRRAVLERCTHLLESFE